LLLLLLKSAQQFCSQVLMQRNLRWSDDGVKEWPLDGLG
jgi:hypothetical protein